MFTFNHVTSIGLTRDEYDRRLAAGEKNLVKGENTFYREIVTEMMVPVTADDAVKAIQGETPTESIKLGDEKFSVTPSVKAMIVGLKLAVNQQVQAENRSAGDDYGSICESFVKKYGLDSEIGRAALQALASRKAKKFAEKWMVDHREWKVK